jgi:peptidoglycan/LPS O-acetylase OafA/YrhL
MAVQRPVATEGITSPRGRLPAVDLLRAFLVAWIIAGHALLGYTAVGGWAYSHIAEVRFSPRVEWVLAALIGSTGVFLMGTFFLIAGIFTAVAFENSSPGAFFARRMLRLGVPYVVVVLVLWPVAKWMAWGASGRRLTWDVVLADYRNLRSGAGWFLLVLLILSGAYVAWRLVLAGPHPSVTPDARYLVLAAVTIAVASFVVRLWLPAHGREPADLHLWEWPQAVVPFFLGAACGRDLAEHVPEPVHRGCGRVALATVVGIPVAALVLGLDDVAAAAPRFVGGWHWESAVLGVAHGVLVVAGSLWLLGFAQRHVVGTGRFATAAARASYAAFLLQSPVLIALAVSLRPTGLPAELKAPLVAAGAVLVCFGLGHLAVARSRLAQIL